MSLDVYLIHSGNTDLTLFKANITHNLTHMADALGVYQHLWHPNALGILMAAELIEPLKVALTKIRLNEPHYKGFNAGNGWGTSTNMQQFLEQYLAACEEYPDSFVEVSG